MLGLHRTGVHGSIIRAQPWKDAGRVTCGHWFSSSKMDKGSQDQSREKMTDQTNTKNAESATHKFAHVWMTGFALPLAQGGAGSRKCHNWCTGTRTYVRNQELPFPKSIFTITSTLYNGTGIGQFYSGSIYSTAMESNTVPSTAHKSRYFSELLTHPTPGHSTPVSTRRLSHFAHRCSQLCARRIHPSQRRRPPGNSGAAARCRHAGAYPHSSSRRQPASGSWSTRGRAPSGPQGYRAGKSTAS